MTNPRIAIIDYGVGNLHSLLRAFSSLGATAFITEDAEAIRGADGIVLPGVGAFASGMRGLEVRGLVGAVKDAAKAGKPLLGICLGAQLLLTEGHEFGTFKGLDLIKGSVVKFPEMSEKIPHIGWNTLAPTTPGGWEGTAFRSLKPNDRVYFVHSYILQPEDPKDVLSETTYGGHRFCSAVQRGRLIGCQFHPEKSGNVGLQILNDFLKMIADV